MWHPEILTPPQQALFSRLGPIADRLGYYLAGGTAVALHLGHRRSEDFDWFAPERLTDALTLAQKLRAEGLEFETGTTGPGTLHGASAGIRVTFLEYLYPPLAPPLSYPDANCCIAHLDDLATMKLAALIQRGARKDFVDVFALCREHRPLGELIDLYGRRYGVRDTAPVLAALSYFDDAERERMPAMLWKADWATIKRAVKGWTRSLLG
jgi:hypothetical protein